MDREDEIKKEICRLENATENDLFRFNDELSRKRIEWFKSRSTSENASSRDTLEVAYQLLLEKFGAAPEEMPVVQRGSDKIVFHSENFCPTLEACKRLGLDTRNVCRLYNEKATDDLVKLVDPRLHFSRNYNKLRPYSAYCEEILVRGDDDRV